MISANLRSVGAQEVHGTFGLCKGSDSDPELSLRIAVCDVSSWTTTNSKARRIQVCACFEGRPASVRCVGAALQSGQFTAIPARRRRLPGDHWDRGCPARRVIECPLGHRPLRLRRPALGSRCRRQPETVRRRMGTPMSSSSALFGAANLRDLNEISAKQFGDGANICGKVSGSSD